MVRDRQIRFQIDKDEEAALARLAQREGLKSASLYVAALTRRALAEEANRDAS